MDIISYEMLIPFLVTCLVIEITPGPNMAYLAILGASSGRRAGLAAVAGIALGLLIVGIATALGLAALISNSNLLYQLLRWVGVLYLLWLSWDAWHSQHEISPGKVQAISSMRCFRRGLATNLLNPKAALFYTSILPTFIETSSAIVPQALGLTGMYVVLATGIHAAIVVLAGTASRAFKRPIYHFWMRRILALLLAGIALWFAWASKP